MSQTNADYVRQYYGVPARRGMRVEIDGTPGVITGFSGPHLKVRLDGHLHSVHAHPTWHVDYLDGKGPRA